MSALTPNWNMHRQNLPDFVEKLRAALAELQILEYCQTLEMDHICIRLADKTKVAALQRELEQIGETISENIVAGRPIPIIQLSEPLAIGTWQTYGIELPYPKEKHAYTDGWEHVEFILPAKAHTAEALEKAFFTLFPHLDKNNLVDTYQYKMDELHAEDDQLPNPTICVKVNGIGIKFHTLSIQEVVGYEINLTP